MTQEKANKQVIWKIDIFRLTGFHAEIQNDYDKTIWNKIVGKDSETANYQRQGKQFLYQEEGDLVDKKLSIAQAPERLDIVFTPREEELRDTEKFRKFPSIGIFPDSVTKFTAIIDKFFEKVNPDFERIALGLVLNFNVESEKDGYKYLSKFIPTLKLDNVTDLIYQINRPKNSEKFNTITINRLSKWAIAKRSSRASSGIRVGKNEDSFACRLDLDINTKSDTKLKSQEMQTKILKELIDHAKNIALNGDVS